jgi:hypothetical protein
LITSGNNTSNKLSPVATTPAISVIDTDKQLINNTNGEKHKEYCKKSVIAPIGYSGASGD